MGSFQQTFPSEGKGVKMVRRRLARDFFLHQRSLIPGEMITDAFFVMAVLKNDYDATDDG